MKYEVLLESPVSNNFRCKLACDSLDIDINKKNKHHLVINANIDKDYNIGVIYGASGSGKTTLAKNIFGNEIFDTPLRYDIPIINQFEESYTYEECASMLSGIGLNSVPCWVRPVNTLSNGQKARAEAALLMSLNKDIIVIDEWTSVVDRNVAKAMSHTIQKYARKKNKKIILLSCHYDVIEWLNPDWLIDCNKQEFIERTNPDFFFNERDKIQFNIKAIGNHSWKYFSKYHYLSDKLPGGKNYYFGLFIGDNQIGFQCFSNYVPQVKGKKLIYHSNRTVIHPDYQGFGLGIKLINITSKYMMENYGYKIMAKFSALPVYKSMIKEKEWKYLGAKRLMGTMQSGKIVRKTGYRDKGIKTFHFVYVG
jgi:energy-coupling factor transporter ATP-binding protein EcfA2